MSLDTRIRERLAARAHEPGFLRHGEATAAIRAVLDLHTVDRTPLYDMFDGWSQLEQCSVCFNAVEERLDYPCPTVRAVAGALDIEEDS